MLHPVHGQGQENFMNNGRSNINGISMETPVLISVASERSESKVICADLVIIYGSYDRCKRDESIDAHMLSL